MRRNSKKNPKLILEFFDFVEKYFFQVKYEKKIQGNLSYFFENKIIFILKYLGAKNCHFRYLKWSEKVSPIMIVIADHEIFKIWSWVIVDHHLARWLWVIVDHKKKYRPLLCVVFKTLILCFIQKYRVLFFFKGLDFLIY